MIINRTGIMLSYFVNFGINNNFQALTDLKWRIPFALQMLPGVVLLVGILFENESPRWLVEKNRIDNARRALSRVRGKPESDSAVEHELEEIVNDFQGREELLYSTTQSRMREQANLLSMQPGCHPHVLATMDRNQLHQLLFSSNFASIGLTGTSAGLFATGIYGVVKVVVTAIGLMLFTEQLGRKWSLIIGATGQAFAMYYIGIHSAVAGPTVAGASLNSSGLFAIVCVYLFVVFYSFGWGPIPFVLAAECAPNHVRSLVMALALMTQWLFNFVIAAYANHACQHHIWDLPPL
jgi:hypothetical protein